PEESAAGVVAQVNQAHAVAVQQFALEAFAEALWVREGVFLRGAGGAGDGVVRRQPSVVEEDAAEGRAGGGDRGVGGGGGGAPGRRGAEVGGQLDVGVAVGRLRQAQGAGGGGFGRGLLLGVPGRRCGQTAPGQRQRDRQRSNGHDDHRSPTNVHSAFLPG